MNEKNINDLVYIIKLLKRKYPSQHASMTMQENAAPLKTAIEANTTLEEKNLKKTVAQMHLLLKCPKLVSGALMPDTCPAGNGPATMPVGGVVAAREAILPAAHSADIACSVHASFFTSELETSELLDQLEKVTRFGPGGRRDKDQVHHPVLDEKVWNNPFLRRLQPIARMHMADQGDGNHFAFIGKMVVTNNLIKSLEIHGHYGLADSLKIHSEVKAIVTHHGSRGLGAAVYKRGLKAAVQHTGKHATGIPEEAAWLDTNSPLGESYWQALQYVARWTKANHQCIHQQFLKNIESPVIAECANQHNFIWKRNGQFFHGKGATPAWKDDAGRPRIGLIPLHMNAPILLTLGSNNENYLSFSPHGAGRNLSRTALLKRYRSRNKTTSARQLKADLDSATHGIDVRWFLGEPDVTECPVAYKDVISLRKQIKQFNLAEVIAEISPLGCIMAGRAPRHEKPLSPKQKRQIIHRANRRKSKQKDWQCDMGQNYPTDCH